MRNIGILILIGLGLLMPRNLLADDGDFGNRMKHGLVAAGISGGLTELCERNLIHSDGGDNQWGCFLLGVIPTIIGAAAFEALQDDMTDMGGDMAAGATGAVIGSGLMIVIDF